MFKLEIVIENTDEGISLDVQAMTSPDVDPIEMLNAVDIYKKLMFINGTASSGDVAQIEEGRKLFNEWIDKVIELRNEGEKCPVSLPGEPMCCLIKKFLELDDIHKALAMKKMLDFLTGNDVTDDLPEELKEVADGLVEELKQMLIDSMGDEDKIREGFERLRNKYSKYVDDIGFIGDRKKEEKVEVPDVFKDFINNMGQKGRGKKPDKCDSTDSATEEKGGGDDGED
jgi:hypothetical protein